MMNIPHINKFIDRVKISRASKSKEIRLSVKECEDINIEMFEILFENSR